MNWFNKQRDQRIKALEETVRGLQREVITLREASTMRVGDLKEWHHRRDTRPILTAIEGVRRLLANAGIEVKEVPQRAPSLDFVKREEPRW